MKTSHEKSQKLQQIKFIASAKDVNNVEVTQHDILSAIIDSQSSRFTINEQSPRFADIIEKLLYKYFVISNRSELSRNHQFGDI